METKLFVATKGFIVHKNKILLLRESNQYADGTQTGMLDVVGGRITPGESLHDCLTREITEETGLTVTIGQSFYVNEAWPVVKGEQWQIIRIFFECLANTDQITLSTDHSEYLWINPADYQRDDLIANLIPAFAAYLKKQDKKV